MKVAFRITNETHKILMAVGCEQNVCLSDAMQIILNDWRSVFATEISAWKKSGANHGQAFVQLSAPAWVRKEEKRTISVFLEIESARDIAVGQAMTMTRKSDFLREIIYYWASLNIEKIKPLLERRIDYLENHMPKMKITRKRFPRDLMKQSKERLEELNKDVVGW